MASFSVRVLNRNGDGWGNLRVCLGFSSLFRGMSRDEVTDSSGRATFSGYDQGRATVLVDGKVRGEHESRVDGYVTATHRP